MKSLFLSLVLAACAHKPSGETATDRIEIAQNQKVAAYREALAEANLPASSDDLDELAIRLAEGRDGTVNYDWRIEPAIHGWCVFRGNRNLSWRVFTRPVFPPDERPREVVVDLGCPDMLREYPD